MSDSDESDLSDYFPSSSGSEMSEYDITSDEEDSDCDYYLKDAQRWARLAVFFIKPGRFISTEEKYYPITSYAQIAYTTPTQSSWQDGVLQQTVGITFKRFHSYSIHNL
ncbi:hypothetical protein NPIL_80281 [Nephila pilipes]|uniref:Uncharacterized protein n=1 Tax=Nephila pilipes TaxID=299642 RepID=A0A8X6U0W5_NEPPI|nr:hypothetical protein NPIL_80281 [Nephila pilipes]